MAHISYAGVRIKIFKFKTVDSYDYIDRYMRIEIK
jgi:hypothetical protein